ncbi:hypothetical protein KIN20_019478 [Parelaphostrongylus tenuis]|uniref:Uncharacterized protein n=1 Tax=Parelaphostrongylus tenuis TaxID=148309 RepID=A0AAD5MPK6_PARTN|nr:hypothetical protein KIN20_019478 [Parelaphostrongylus tenuis]
MKSYVVSQSTYLVVIEHLREKYEVKEDIIKKLHRVRTIQAKSSRFIDQEKMCESSYSMIIQFRQHGEFVDNRTMQKLVFEKFTENIRRHALQQGTRVPNSEAQKTEDILTSIKQYIKPKLKMEAQLGSKFEAIKDTMISNLRSERYKGP